MSATATERACPACGASVPSLAGYADWCEHCGWNLQPPQPHIDEGRFAQFVAALAQRAPRGGGTLATRTLAVLIAVAVLLFDAALIVGGVAAVAVEPNLVTLLFGATTVLIGVLIRPRLPGRPSGAVLDPALTPTLHALVARIAEARGVPAPRGIIVDAEWNAAWVTARVRRERWLVLGLPLLTVLEPQQRVALIAHEVGHEHSGDLTRTLVVGSAVDALDALSAVMDPTRDESPLDWIARPLMWFASRPVDAILWLQARLLFRDRQRAEYQADERAAEIAGAAAVIGLHERLLQFPTVELVVRRHTLDGSDGDVLDGVRAALEAVPERERERRRRVARLEQTRLTDTHPPLALRIAALEQRSPHTAIVTLDGWSSARIDDELAPLERDVGRALIDDCRSSLYAGY